jgi:hypothetical protein
MKTELFLRPSDPHQWENERPSDLPAELGLRQAGENVLRIYEKIEGATTHAGDRS